jgi:hypothetical protein
LPLAHSLVDNLTSDYVAMVYVKQQLAQSCMDQLNMAYGESQSAVENMPALMRKFAVMADTLRTPGSDGVHQRRQQPRTGDYLVYATDGLGGERELSDEALLADKFDIGCDLGVMTGWWNDGVSPPLAHGRIETGNASTSTGTDLMKVLILSCANS